MAQHLLPVAAVLAAVALLFAGGAADYPWSMCGDDSGTFMPNGTYQAHLNLIAAALPKTASKSPDLFASIAVGAIPEQVWAMGLCRGDSNAAACFGCLTQAFRDLPGYCSGDKDATIYYDPCMVHYSDVHPGALPDDDGPMLDTYTTGNTQTITSEPGRFVLLLAALVNATADYAAYNSTRRFATGEVDTGFDREFPKLYTLAQCTPDQTPAQCRKCLSRLISQSLDGFRNRIGGRVLAVSCTYRYESASFYSGPAMVRLTSPSSGAPAPAPAANFRVPTADGGDRKYHVPWVAIAVVLPTLAALNLVVCLCFRRRQRRLIAQTKHQSKPMYSTEAEDMEMVDSMMMDVSTLRAATGDFDESNKLGEGGFGTVYKGVLPDGEEIAVKRLSSSSSQGVEELMNKLALVAKLKHRNLVRLVGVCLEQQERLLVYEFVPNRSLDLILFDTENEQREKLDWGQRYKIINGIALGLQFLHEDSQLKVVHRDLKPSNILLDENMCPKISDFGLVRIFGRDQTQDVTSRVVGTYGYMAPEYMMRGNYSVKSDAFSFGVMVLEIVTGRKNNNNNDGCNLLSTVWMHWEAGTVAELFEPSMGMGGSFPEGDVLRCIHIGLLCVQGDPTARPVMSSVVEMLGSNTVILQAPSKSGIFAKNNNANAAVPTVSLNG